MTRNTIGKCPDAYSMIMAEPIRKISSVFMLLNKESVTFPVVLYSLKILAGLRSFALEQGT